MKKIIGKDKIVKIGLVKPNTWNPKDAIEESEGVRAVYEQIKGEIRKKGLFEAITVRSIEGGYEILDGYHRYRACLDLGYEQIRVNDLGKVDDKLARAITVVKEQKKVPISELGVADIMGWYKEEGVSDDDVQDLLGYDEKEFNRYNSLFDIDLDGLEKEMITKQVTCPDCGHKFNI